MKSYIAQAEGLVRAHGTRDPERIARELGITVLYAPFQVLYGLSLSLDGYRVIVVNADLPELTRKLVVAHEIGHFLLHPGGNFLYVLDRTRMYGKEEYQANVFAFELLFGEAAQARWVLEAAATGCGAADWLSNTGSTCPKGR